MYSDTCLYPDIVTDVATRVKRLSRIEQQQQTKEAILDAAIELFVAHGIEATSIEDVTAHAGFTRGAFYSNFVNKADLVLATSVRFLDILHAAARPDPEHPASDVGEAYRDRLQRAASVLEGGAAVMLAEMSLYAIRHEAMREPMAALHQAQLFPAMEFVRDQLAASGAKKPANVSYELLATVVQSLTFGLRLMAQVDPAIEPERAIAVATRALFKGLETK